MAFSSQMSFVFGHHKALYQMTTKSMDPRFRYRLCKTVHKITKINPSSMAHISEKNIIVAVCVTSLLEHNGAEVENMTECLFG